MNKKKIRNQIASGRFLFILASVLDKENGGLGSSNYKSNDVSYGEIPTIFNTIPGGEVPNPHQEKMIIKNLMNKESEGFLREMITFHKGKTLNSLMPNKILEDP